MRLLNARKYESFLENDVLCVKESERRWWHENATNTWTGQPKLLYSVQSFTYRGTIWLENSSLIVDFATRKMNPFWEARYFTNDLSNKLKWKFKSDQCFGKEKMKTDVSQFSWHRNTWFECCLAQYDKWLFWKPSRNKVVRLRFKISFSAEGWLIYVSRFLVLFIAHTITTNITSGLINISSVNVVHVPCVRSLTYNVDKRWTFSFFI